MSTLINTGLLTKGLRSEFFSRFSAVPTFFGDLTTRIASDADQETYKFLGSVPRLREWGTGRVIRGITTESYTVENLKYESTIEVDRDELADDQTGQIRIRVQELAQAAATHKDYLTAQLLINGGTTGFNSWDGQTFFGSAHSYGGQGSQVNDISVDISNIAANVNEPDDVDLTGPKTKQYGFDQAWGQMTGFVDNQGEPIPMGMDGLVVVCHPTQTISWMEALTSTLVNNTSNVIAGLGVRVLPMPWFTDKSMWYLLKTNQPMRPFIFQDREPIEFVALTEGTDEAFRREKFLYGVRARYKVTYGHWYYAIRANFTT